MKRTHLLRSRQATNLTARGNLGETLCQIAAAATMTLSSPCKTLRNLALRARAASSSSLHFSRGTSSTEKLQSDTVSSASIGSIRHTHALRAKRNAQHLAVLGARLGGEGGERGPESVRPSSICLLSPSFSPLFAVIAARLKRYPQSKSLPGSLPSASGRRQPAQSSFQKEGQEREGTHCVLRSAGRSDVDFVPL